MNGIKSGEHLCSADGLDANHERVWLSPRCDEERTWCQDNQGPCDCGDPSVEYVRADIAASTALAFVDRVERLTTLLTEAFAAIAHAERGETDADSSARYLSTLIKIRAALNLSEETK